MITKPKPPEDIAKMAEGGRMLGEIRDALIAMAAPGVSLQDIEDEAMRRIALTGGVASFATVKDYKWATCLCVNDEVVHGIPTKRKLVAGDVLTADVGLLYKGFHTDTADTTVVGGPENTPDNVKKFLDCGRETLKNAIAVAVAGNRIGHISEAIEKGIHSGGYSVIQALTGHAVGKTLHEEPMIPGYLERPIDRTPILVPGLTIAIEVIYAMGKGDIIYSSGDGWTLASRDGSLTAVFEHTIAIGQTANTVLTQSKS